MRSDLPTEEIITAYENGLSLKKLAKYYSCSKTAIIGLLHRNNISTSDLWRKNRGKILEHTEQIINYYKNGLTTVDLAKKYSCSDATIWHLLRRNGVSTRDRSMSARKYSCNENYFDSIDTPEKAYILGFFYADGCNHKSSNRWLIGCTDLDILEKIKSEMNSNFNIEKVKGKTIGQVINGSKPIKTNKQQYVLRISSKHLCNMTEKAGAMQNKTFIIEFPIEEQVPNHLIRHFIRGLYDGDGWFCKSPQFGICGTKSICEGVKQYLNKELGASISIISKQNIYEVIAGGKNNVIKIMQHLYTDSTIHLDRKIEKYKAFEAAINRRERLAKDAKKEIEPVPDII